MVERNCALPFYFYCLTDNTADLPSEVIGIQIDKQFELESYWWKMCLFNLDWKEPTVYFDLDIIIQNNFDHLLDNFDPNKILTIRPDDAGIDRTYESFTKHIAIINTSIMVFQPSQHKKFFDKFIENVDYNILEYFGMDRYISSCYLSHCDFISYNDYYYRWKDDKTPSCLTKVKIIDGIKYVLAHDPSKSFCIISQTHPDMYQGLEEYFL